MIPIEKLRQVTRIYTHASCPDGLASAMILKDAFRMLGMAPRIEFLTHNTPEHKNAQPPTHDQTTILFCDIAPWAPTDPADRVAQIGRMRDWAQFHPTTIVLDHHVGAREIVEAFGPLGVYADAEKEPGVSGAFLACREVWLLAWHESGTGLVSTREAVQDFAYCVGARDTWQTQDPRFQRGQYISKFLMSKPASYWLDETLVPGELERYKERWHPPYLRDGEIEMGRALYEAHEEAIRQAVDQCTHSTVVGHGLFVFQEQACGFRLCSDVAEALRKDPKKPLAPARGRVVAGFAYVVNKPGGPPSLVYSLRGLNGFDVEKFATANGGGGHTAAAGFSVDPHRELIGRTPYDDIRSRLAAFLDSPEGLRAAATWNRSAEREEGSK